MNSWHTPNHDKIDAEGLTLCQVVSTRFHRPNRFGRAVGPFPLSASDMTPGVLRRRGTAIRHKPTYRSDVRSLDGPASATKRSATAQAGILDRGL